MARFLNVQGHRKVTRAELSETCVGGVRIYSGQGQYKAHQDVFAWDLRREVFEVDAHGGPRHLETGHGGADK